MNIFALDTTHDILETALENAGHTLIRHYATPVEELVAVIDQADGIIIRSRVPMNADFLKHATKLRFIARFGAGMENIDLNYAASRGIHCLNAPEGNRQAVGEHALGMLLNLFNRINIADDEVRRGLWLRQENTGEELDQKTVGIIGFGRMGSAFNKVLGGFDSKVLLYDKYLEDFGSYANRKAEMEDLFREAEVVSLHLPLNEETRYLVNDDFIQRFKKPFYLINTSRGPIVETAALVRGLESGKILGACLDVLEYEKASFKTAFDGDMPEPLNYLIHSDRVILTPHIAGWTTQSFEKMARILADRILNL